jgi:pSer/pThr/pTyr-binding forkhead associated (FHA) protein
VRPSHDTREETIVQLRRGYLAGRLGTDTFAHRLEDALESASREQLRGLTADLPAAPPRTLIGRLRARFGVGPRALPDLVGACVLIGRSSSCQIVLGDDTVSRRHAELRFEDGRWLLRDLGSSNGTYVNGRWVAEAEVRPGDVIHLGGCRLRW